MSAKKLQNVMDRVQTVVSDRNSGFKIAYDYTAGSWSCEIFEKDDGHLLVAGRGESTDEAAVSALMDLRASLIDWGWEDGAAAVVI